MAKQTVPRVILLMGVAGSGKTTVGRLLAHDLGWSFYDADEYHPPANVEKMARGEPLTDADRVPWLDALRALIDDLVARGEAAVVACSALKQPYRDHLTAGVDAVRCVYLQGDFELIRSRLAARTGHFFDPQLLRSQFDALEEPADALIVSIDRPPDALVREIVEALIRV